MTGTNQGTEVSQGLSQKQREAIFAHTAFLLEASRAETDAFMEELLQNGDIELDFLPENDDLPLEDVEAEMDADWDFLADEDESVADATDDFDIEVLPEEEGLFDPGGDYAIRVVEDAGGRVRCRPPTVEWVAARGLTPTGKTALWRISGRSRTLAAVAAWLEREAGDLLLLGPDVFAEQWTPVHPVDCLRAILGDSAKAKDGTERSSFSRRIRNVRLVWRNGWVPLRGTVFFAGQLGRGGRRGGGKRRS